jgi:coiled-coil domain-containing protein 63/114
MAIIEAKSSEARRKAGGMHKARDASLQYLRQVKILESRLDKSVIKLNEALQRNKELRMDIDNLRRERLNFQEVYRKVERELQEKKREMASVIEISNIAYEARDQAQNEIAALRAQADREQAAFEHEMAELNAALEADLRAQEAERQKALLMSDINALDHGGSDWKRKAGTVGPAGSQLGRRNSFMGDRRSSIKNLVGIEDVFGEISEATGITNVGELVDHFISMEDANFKLFEHNQALNSEIEKLEETAAELQREFDKMRGPSASSQRDQGDVSRKELARELDEKAAKAAEREAALRTRASSLTDQLGALKSQLQRMFERLGCNTSEVRAQYGELLTQGVTDGNMMQYLGIVEKRANDVLAIYHAERRRKEAAEAAGAPPLVPSAPPVVRHEREPLEILPPSTTRDPLDEEDENFEDEDRPLTRNELRVYANKSVRTGGVSKERSNQNSSAHGRGHIEFRTAPERLALGGHKSKRNI